MADDMIQPTGNNKKPRAWLVVSLILIAALLGVIYYFFDPMESRWMPRCVFHQLTGLQCMGCGSQRMLHALLHGDFAGAFRANLFGMLMLPVIALMAWAEARREKHPAVYRRLFSPAAVYGLIVLMILWLILRHIIGI